ncbi:hypothetical protein BWK63_12655 [Flavobacterium covae]|nr:hypothetical protein BWK63_12655 [Flavobacterium covae]
MDFFYKTIAIFFLVAFFSCKQKDEQINTSKTMESLKNIDSNEINLDLIKKIMKDQERVENEEKEYDTPYELSEKDLNITSDLIKIYLKNDKFNFLNSKEFDKKIKEIFNIDPNVQNCFKIKTNNNWITLFGNELDGKQNTLIDNEFEHNSVTNNIFISKKNRFISKSYLLKELIIIEDNNSYKLIIPKNIIEINKFIFNDNKESLNWLKNNDENFLKSLVLNNGYTNNKELLSWVLNKINFKIDNYEEINKLLWHKTCDEKLVFHKETLDIINEKENKKEYFNFLNDEYLRYIDKSELPISEKAEIIANILNFIALNTNDYDPFSNMGFFAQNFDGGRKTEGKYSKEFIKHNFYNLKDFKKQWEESKIDGDGVAYPGNIE